MTCYLDCLFALLLLCTTSTLLPHTRAVVITPVADLYGTIPTTYAHLDTQPYAQCPRLMQLLFNEQVTIIRKQPHYTLIEIEHAFHITKNGPAQLLSRYWIDTNNIVPLDTLPLHAALKTVPQSISWRKPATWKQHNNTVTLAYPWHEPQSEKTYSAGTRFTTKISYPTFHEIQLWDQYQHRIITAALPHSFCVQLSTTATPVERQQAFVSLVRSWTHPPQLQGTIPYVLGGCSFSGFDCSGLVLRAAQCCSIPYFFKNTTTLAHFLKPLTKHDQLQEGDLIWIPEHVMIISDLRKNLLVEARSLHHGYGIVQEIPISKQFLNITTYRDLYAAFAGHKELKRLDRFGTVRQTISSFKILRMASAWDCPHANRARKKS